MLAQITRLLDPTAFSGGTYLLLGMLALATAFCIVGPVGGGQDGRP